MNNVIVKTLENDGRQWYKLDGVEPNTGWDFEYEEFAVHSDGSILDADGHQLTKGDLQEIAVRNALKKEINNG